MAISTSAKDIKLGDVISCTILGAGAVPNVVAETCVGIISGAALTNVVAAAAGHANVAPDFEGENVELYGDLTDPEGFRKYPYFQFKNAAGDIREVGLPWIGFGSVTRATRQAMKAIFTDFDISRTNELKEKLRIWGFGDVVLTPLEITD